MKKKLLFCSLFVTFFLLTGCIPIRIRVPSRIWKLEVRNPTSYTYHVSTDSLIHVIENSFKNNKELYSRTSWKHIRTEPHKFGYDYCIQMHSWSTSPIYRSNRGKKGCPYLIELYLCCDSLNPVQTSVTTAVYFSWVCSGGKKDDKWKHDTPPSTIEEYQLLRLIGRLVGERNMPEVNYPRKLPLEELESRKGIY